MQPEKSADQRERTDDYRRAKERKIEREYDMDRPGIAVINLDGIRTLIG